MSLLNIDRWHTRYRSTQPLPGESVRRWNAALEDLDLDRELADLVGADEWLCIRRLQLQMRLGEAADAFDAALRWREALLSALRSASEEDGDNISRYIVRYADKREALRDMLYRAALGHLERAWAWRQIGLLPEGAHAAPGEVLRHAARALAAEPAWIAPLLLGMLQAESHSGAFTALMTSLSREDWATLLDTAPQTRILWRLARAAEIPPQAGAVSQDFETPLARKLIEWLQRHPWQAKERSEGLAVLLAAASRRLEARADAQLATPAMTTALHAARRRIANILEATGSALQRASMPRALPAAQPFAQKPDETNIAPPSGENRRAEDVLVPALQGEAPLPTEAAGLLFLIRLLPQTGLLEEAAAFEDVALGAVLHHLATVRLGVAPRDPAVRAFCGGREPESETPALPQALQEATLRCAQELQTLLERLLGEVEAARLDKFIARSGRIRFEPGWIEVHLPLSEADPALRRAGLDLDPGWVAWLDCVLRFVYD